MIKGGADDDTLTGGAGNDRMTGWDGDDTLSGGGGDDTLCDSSEDSGSSCVSDKFTGGDGDDKFWYAYKVSCAGAGGDLDGTSDAGGGTNDCGPLDWGANPIWTNCNGGDITSEPSTCP